MGSFQVDLQIGQSVYFVVTNPSNNAFEVRYKLSCGRYDVMSSDVSTDHASLPALCYCSMFCFVDALGTTKLVLLPSSILPNKSVSLATEIKEEASEFSCVVQSDILLYAPSDYFSMTHLVWHIQLLLLFISCTQGTDKI